MTRPWFAVLVLLCVYYSISPCENSRVVKKSDSILRILCLIDTPTYREVKNKITASLEKASKPLLDRHYGAVVKIESIEDLSPRGLLNVAARQLAHDSINTVFLYSTQDMDIATVDYMKEMISSMGIPFMVWTSDNTVHIKVGRVLIRYPSFTRSLV